MGVWGDEPWDNDAAADFFGDLWDAVPIVDRVHAGLRADDTFVQVAALWLCAQLCRVYVWPVGRIDETRSLAIAVADSILAGTDPSGYLELYDDDPEVRARIERFRTTIADA